jgi:hypothetical protein
MVSPSSKLSVLKSTKLFRDALKAIVKINVSTVSDYLHHVVNISVLQQAKICPLAEASLLMNAQETIDHRIDKPCAGWACLKCKHNDACTAGDSSVLFEMSAEHRQYLTARGLDVETTYETVTMIVPVTRITPLDRK